MAKRKVKAMQSNPETLFRAGCGREWPVMWSESELAYTELAFQECSACMHRVEPEGGPSFCTLRPVESKHPFADLSGLDWLD